MKISKSGLAVRLSKLDVFTAPDPRLEQHPTDSEVASDVLWNAYMLGDIEGLSIADLGCGTGIIGIGALLLNAKEVHFVEQDGKAIETLKKNMQEEDLEDSSIIHHEDITDFNKKVDVVIQNPPFGTREKHVDQNFLKKAFSITNVIYSLHKTTTAKFIEELASNNDFKLSHRWDYNFPIKRTMKQHKKDIHRIKVTCFRIIKEMD